MWWGYAFGYGDYYNYDDDNGYIEQNDRFTDQYYYDAFDGEAINEERFRINIVEIIIILISICCSCGIIPLCAGVLCAYFFRSLQNKIIFVRMSSIIGLVIMY